MAPARPAVGQEEALTRELPFSAQQATRARERGQLPLAVSSEMTSFRKEPTMTTWLPRWIALLVLVFLLAAAPPPRPWAAEVARLIEQLGSDRFAEREAASK